MRKTHPTDGMGGMTNEKKNYCRSYGCNDDNVSGSMRKQQLR